MIIKKASTDEFLQNKGKTNEYNLRKVEMLNNGSLEYYYAFDNSGFVGEIMLYTHLSDEKIADGVNNCYIGDLYVVSEKRGKGIGTELLKYVIAKARERSFKTVNLYVESDKSTSELYLKNGFKDTGYVTNSCPVFTEIRFDNGIKLMNFEL